MSLPTNNSNAPVPVVMVAPPSTVPGPPVSVVQTSFARLVRKVFAVMVAILGQIVPILQSEAPTLLKWFPNVPYLGNVITALGFGWMMFEKSRDAAHMAVANFSPAPAAPIGTPPPGN